MGGTILYTFLRRSFLATDAIVKVYEVIAEAEKLGFQSKDVRKQIGVFECLGLCKRSIAARERFCQTVMLEYELSLIHI